MRGGLVDNASKCAELLGAGGYSGVIQGICHLGFSSGWDFIGETIGEARSSCHQIARRAVPVTVCGLALKCERRSISRLKLGSLLVKQPRGRTIGAAAFGS